MYMQCRSLVQLIQQTQAIRYIINVAQKTVASEAVRVGLPTGEIASQLDAVK